MSLTELTGRKCRSSAFQPSPFDFRSVFLADDARIAHVIRRVVGDPSRAEDLAVEAFWKLWRNPRAHGDAAGAWLYRTGADGARRVAPQGTTRSL